MQDTLRHQKEQMMEDKKWLEKEERLLVGNRASLTFVNPLSLSLCPPAPAFNVVLTATRNEAALSNVNPLAHSRRLASFKLNVPLLTVPKRGSTSVLYKVNLPVLLQDPMGPDDTASPGVRVHMYRLEFQIKGRINSYELVFCLLRFTVFNMHERSTVTVYYWMYVSLLTSFILVCSF